MTIQKSARSVLLIAGIACAIALGGYLATALDGSLEALRPAIADVLTYQIGALDLVCSAFGLFSWRTLQAAVRPSAWLLVAE